MIDFHPKSQLPGVVHFPNTRISVSFSDFQKNAFEDYESWELDTLNEYFLYQLPSSSKANFYVDTVWLEKPFIEVGNSFELKGILKASAEITGKPSP